MSKKILTILILMVMLLSFSACKKNEEPDVFKEEPKVYYTVTFYDEAGTIIKSEQVEQGQSATAPAIPSKESTDAEVFVGSWDNEFTNVQNDLTINLVYVASPRTYVVTFNLYDEEAPLIVEVPYNNNTTYFEDPVRDGYLFCGWFYDEECTRYFNFYKKVTVDTEVYSSWAKRYNVTLELDGGSIEEDAVTYYENMKTKFVLPIPQKDGYYFRGYYESSDLTGENILSLPVGSKGDKTFYASYVEAKLENAYISFLGDSITTYANYINSEYATFYPGNSDLESVKDTWWYQVVENTGGHLCVNNSCGGSAIIGGSSTAAGSMTRLTRLASSTLGSPDIIVIYMGINDCYNGSTKVQIKDAYQKMINSIYSLYPNVDIFLCNYGYEEITSAHPGLRDEYNEMISEISAENNLPYADLSVVITNSSYLVDRAHPNKAGMKLIADAVTKVIVDYYTNQ